MRTAHHADDLLAGLRRSTGHQVTGQNVSDRRVDRHDEDKQTRTQVGAAIHPLTVVVLLPFLCGNGLAYNACCSSCRVCVGRLQAAQVTADQLPATSVSHGRIPMYAPLGWVLSK